MKFHKKYLDALIVDEVLTFKTVISMEKGYVFCVIYIWN